MQFVRPVFGQRIISMLISSLLLPSLAGRFPVLCEASVIVLRVLPGDHSAGVAKLMSKAL
jgi:hypothetical protein